MNRTVGGRTIGIDLGTTFSSVGVYFHGKVEIIANDQGNRITPSYVAFNSEGERLIGDAAKNQLINNSENTVYDSKRLIGREWMDKNVQQDIKTFPFKVVNKKGKPHVKLQTPLGLKTFAAEEISAMILRKMKETAEDYLGEIVTKAVVTVPAYFNDAQRQATKLAGKIAGLDILRILNEPTAAAIAYGLDKNHGKSTILVFDLGGGTIDVSILTINNGIFEVLATDGDTHLGGEDFDQRVIDYFVKLYKEKKGKDFSMDNRAVQRLRREVEKAKRALSTCYQARIEIDSFFQGEDFSEPLSRAKFEELNKDLFQSTIKPLQNAFESANISKSEIEKIVVVGGSTRIPKIQALVKEYFHGKELVKSINPDEAIAFGATALASVLSGENFLSSIVLKDVTPLTLGINSSLNEVIAVLIPRNTAIPTKQSRLFTTCYDDQEVVGIEVLEGERIKSKDNHFLGKFALKGIRPAPREIPSIEVTFNIDLDGILEVTAKDTENGNTKNITISDIRNQLTAGEIAKMLEDAEFFAEEDKKKKETILNENGFQNYNNTWQNFSQNMNTYRVFNSNYRANWTH